MDPKYKMLHIFIFSGYLWLGKTPWLRLSKLGVLRVLRLRVLVLGLGVQWGGVGVAKWAVRVRKEWSG